MRILALFLLSIGLPTLTFTQSIEFQADQFASQVLAYDPPQRPGVKPADYNMGRQILRETAAATQNQPANFNVADYWNVAVAFSKLGEPKDHIEMAFRQAMAIEPDRLCEYMESFGESKLQREIPEAYTEQQRYCDGAPKEVATAEAPRAYARREGLDADLVAWAAALQERDQRQRTNDEGISPAQKQLDRTNQAQVDSLLEVLGRYPGRSDVGERYENAVWMTIQHSNVSVMERYLPLIHAAYTSENLGAGPLKMLLDRIGSARLNKQFFGSQVGVPLADDGAIREVKKTYGL